MTEDAIRENAATLSRPAKIAFVLSIAERLFPNYVVFSRRRRWGDPTTLRRAMDVAWDLLSGEVPSAKTLRELRQAVEEAAPDTEKFKDPLVSAALDAATAVESLVNLLRDDDAEHVVDATSYARDTVDLYVQELEDMDTDDPDLEERIRTHALMQRELRRQDDDLEYLRQTPIGPDDVDALRQRWSNVTTSPIDVSV
jgi:hypothetical protein